MVVLAISIVSKSGKALVSRQFVDMTRIRMEGLLAAFPKLLGSGKQHTYIETENVRYVYQPMEGLYLLLVTNKASNILEDLETLRLLSKVVPEYTLGLDEDSVGRAAFDLLFAFDEVISLGYKENVTVAQVKQNTEMESHEEKLHKMIIQSKINDTKDVMKKKAIEIDKSKIEARGGGGRLPASAMSISSSAMGSGSLGGRSTPGIDLDSGPSFNRPESFSSSFNKQPPAGPKKGMQLGKAKKANDFLDSLRAEGEIVDVDAAPSRATAASAAAPIVPADPVSIVIEERLQIILNKDGGMENFEVQGTMSLQVQPTVDACLRVEIATGENRNFQFKTHPNIDKQLYTRSNVLGLKDPSRPFPTEGAPVGILKWRMQTQDEAALPLSINCWPSTSGSDSFVNIEYESTVDFDLHNLIVAIPVSQAPRVNQVDGDWQFDSRKRLLLWKVDLVDESNKSGSMEFVLPATSPDSFFPVEVSFTANHTLCDVSVTGVTTVSDGAPAKYSCKSLLGVESYQVL